MARKTSKKRTRQTKVAATTPVDFGLLENFIGFKLRRAQDVSFQAFMRRTGLGSLRPGRFSLLLLIANNPSLNQTLLGEAVGRDKSTITPAVRDLEKAGLIVRQRLASDQRAYTLRTTAAGRRMLNKLMLHARAHEAELDRIVGRKDKARFAELLQRITAALS